MAQTSLEIKARTHALTWSVLFITWFHFWFSDTWAKQATENTWAPKSDPTLNNRRVSGNRWALEKPGLKQPWQQTEGQTGFHIGWHEADYHWNVLSQWRSFVLVAFSLCLLNNHLSFTRSLPSALYYHLCNLLLPGCRGGKYCTALHILPFQTRFQLHPTPDYYISRQKHEYFYTSQDVNL